MASKRARGWTVKSKSCADYAESCYEAETTAGWRWADPGRGRATECGVGSTSPILRKPGQAVMVSREQPSAFAWGVSQLGRAMTPG